MIRQISPIALPTNISVIVLRNIQKYGWRVDHTNQGCIMFKGY